MNTEEQTTSLSKIETQPRGVEIVIDNRVEVPSQQVEAASIACRLVLNKLLNSEQQHDPVQIIFVSRIMDKGKKCDHHGEAFPDGKRIVLAMDAPNMKSWQEQLGQIASMLLLTAHEATHIAQIRKGDPPPSSIETIKSHGGSAYQNEPHELAAHREAFDLFKALRPHARGTLRIGGKSYTVPNQSSYVVDLSEFPAYIRS